MLEAPSAPAESLDERPAVADRVGRQRQLITTLKGWLGAWSEQRADDYMDYYASDFSPPDGLSRRQWEWRRRDRISAPRFIRVSMTGLETEMLGETRARATFLQYYRSDGYTDTVRKTLELIWEGDRWRIVRESSEAA